MYVPFGPKTRTKKQQVHSTNALCGAQIIIYIYKWYYFIDTGALGAPEYIELKIGGAEGELSSPRELLKEPPALKEAPR